MIDFLNGQDLSQLSQLSVQSFLEKMLQIQQTLDKDHIVKVKEYFPAVQKFKKFSKPWNSDWSASTTRKELISLMNSLGFCRGSDLVMGHPSHIPQGWPNSIKWESWKSHKCQKPESRLIIKSILAANWNY